MAALIKSVVYLGLAGGTGWLLMQFATPNEDKKRLISQSLAKETSQEVLTKKALILEKIREAANSDTPIYLKKEETKPRKRDIN
ncbi:unnamed protein product [Diamesa serratosioi]